MSSELLQFLVVFILGSGGTGVLSFLVNYTKNRKSGKLESQETWASRMTDQAVRDAEKVNAAEARVDRAEAETEVFRQKYFEQQARAAFYVAFIRANSLRPPKWPPDDEDLGGDPA